MTGTPSGPDDELFDNSSMAFMKSSSVNVMSTRSFPLTFEAVSLYTI